MTPQIMADRMTPSALEVLLHFHSIPEPHPRATAPAVMEAIAGFVQLEILDPLPPAPGAPCPPRYCGCHVLTPKGRFWLDMILATPMPVVRYADPREPRE